MEQQLRTPEGSEYLTGQAVPAARPLSDFCMERVGDEVILFDSEHNRYHTLNAVAFEIWQLCDGICTIELIAAQFDDVRIEAIESAISQLGESGLFAAPEESFESTMHRRRMMKLVAAGAIGTVGIPVVASITRLGPEASASHNPCGSCPGQQCCCVRSNGTFGCDGRNNCTNFGGTCHPS